MSFKTDGAGGPGGDFNKPLCNGTTQVAAKAYPGLREIAVLKEYATSKNAAVQGNSVVASICPKDLTSATSDPVYGYNPAVSALVNRLKEKLRGSCLPRPLTVKPDGSVPCVMAEALPPQSLNGTSCADFCTAKKRTRAGSTIVADVTAAMQNSKICDSTSGVPCSQMCVCQLPEEAGDALTTCQNDVDGASTTAQNPGFCYVDPDNGAGLNTDIIAHCPVTQRRILRFVGNNPALGIAVPLAGSYTFLSCGENYP
jgi:hypothetical protein